MADMCARDSYSVGGGTLISVRLSTISGNLAEIGLGQWSRLNGVKWEAYKIANLCAQFTDRVSIPTRCTGGRWRCCSRRRDQQKCGCLAW